MSSFRTPLCLGILLTSFCSAGQYRNFKVAIYIPAAMVRRFEDQQLLTRQWARISSQLDVDKVYIEVQRDRIVVDDNLIERVKGFFMEKGIKVAGGMCLSDGSIGGQFRSFCYTDSNDREFIKKVVQLAARHFDELIQDDFFFVTTKYDSDISAKGSRSWTQFRLDLMREASQELLIKPAKQVNPRIKMVIKYPNWYEHFQGLGFDLELQPFMFDGIYTGTETRDPQTTDQNLQEYESYLIFRYFENISPGRNGGGWVDTFSIRFIDRYAEQLWDTMFAKAPEITLFEWSAMTRPIRLGERDSWQQLPTSFDYQAMLQSYNARNPQSTDGPTYASVASFCLRQVDRFLHKLGRPIGLKSYKPYHSWGDDFLHNYLGNIGIPIDLYPSFPEDANLVLLTESAAFDPQIIQRIKTQLARGRSVVITSGLLKALQGKGIEDIVEVKYTDKKILANQYLAGYGAGAGTTLGSEQGPHILLPQIIFLTNDAWPIIRALANGRGYPLLLLDRYSKGTLYIWTIPDNFNDLYLLPSEVTSAIKDYLLTDMSVRVDGPSHVALFVYDNGTFIVQSYRHDTVNVTISTRAGASRIRNLFTDQLIEGRPRTRQRAWPMAFDVQLLPHSYIPFTIE